MRFGLFFQAAPESPRHSDAERYAVMFDLISLTGSREAIACTISP